MAQSVRIDKWLWATRFYKTRTSAAAACHGGKIKRSGVTLKPSSNIKPGDTIEVPSHDGSHKKIIEVVEPLDKRVAAPIAQAAYIDHTKEDVLKEALERNQEQKENRLTRKKGDQGRMTKKNRRAWDQKLGGFFE